MLNSILKLFQLLRSEDNLFKVFTSISWVTNWCRVWFSHFSHFSNETFSFDDFNVTIRHRHYPHLNLWIFLTCLSYNWSVCACLCVSFVWCISFLPSVTVWWKTERNLCLVVVKMLNIHTHTHTHTVSFTI